MNTAGPVSVGQDTSNVATLNISSGSLSVGTGSGTDQGFYVGNLGTGTVTQSGGTVSTPFLALANYSSGSGTYNVNNQGAILNVTGGGVAASIGGQPANNGTSPGGTGILNISHGTVDVNNTLEIYNTTNTAVNLSGGLLEVGALNTDGNPSRFNWTAGTLNLTNSSLTVGTGGPLGSNPTLGSGQTLQISGANASLFVENGTLNENGNAVITVDNYIDVGNAGTGTVNQSGGTNSIYYLFMGFNSSASGTYNLGGTGTLSATGSEYIGSSGSALFTQNGGTNTAGGTLSIGSSGTYTLSNGILSAGALNVASGGTFNWTSGTLNLTSSSLTVDNGGTLGPSLTLGSNQTLQISGTGQALNISGVGNLNLSGGGLNVPVINQSGGTFTDTGTLLLAGTGGNAATYNLSGGTLAVGSLNAGSGAVFNWTGGTLNITNSTPTVGNAGALRSGLGAQ